jgi:hypothetical protein
VHAAAVKIESVLTKVPDLESLNSDVSHPGVKEPCNETLLLPIQDGSPAVL